ncbi:cell division protein FtsQ [Rhodoferax koreense]|uniref:Cell division protein FtsQ n=1 Tax=Rhodoferax koreensis TaxID=1842727 RepID=A0A1P8K1M6_9BURK|nr:cell division protein FtsQ/DivIB [Rhodoferax koreense]APW39895.1 cell division protein FtsQ [Rhodoferax koreense]
MRPQLAVPTDVKLMNATASVLFLGFAVLLLASGVWWALRQPMFTISGITVQGEVSHNNALTLRANIANKVRGNFFTIDLAATKSAFETVPWVRQAVVRREFPNHLRVILQEHQAAAYWGPEGESRLLNNYGEIFEANVDEVEREDLPRLTGPAEESGQVLGMYRVLAPLFEPLDVGLEEVDLSNRGGWRVATDGGAVIELGRGTSDEIVQRAQRFIATISQVAGQYGRTVEAVERADLRYGEGYALRMRGVSTGTAPPPPKKKTATTTH